MAKTLWLGHLNPARARVGPCGGHYRQAYLIKAIVGLRVSEEIETIGLDLAEHGEEGYHA